MLSNPINSNSISFDEDLSVEEDENQPQLLTSLWEYIIRTKTLPDGLNLCRFFETLHGRLKNPEWEIRQNALRVLIDLIPLVPTDQLDDHISKIFLDILNNLGHAGPAVRKGAMDVLKTYLNYTQIPNAITRDLVEKGIEKYQDNKITTNVVLGVILSLPYIINSRLNDTTIFYIIHKLLDNIVKVLVQETVLRALVRIRDLIGNAKFQAALSTHETYNSQMDFEMLCDIYDLHPSSSEFDRKIKNDHVILETEIHLQSGPAITMKIHEEQDVPLGAPNDNTSINSRTFKVLSEAEGIDFARRTPRRVHFGGEIVKLRTPDSDSNIEDNDATISIISEDGDKPVIEIKYIENETKTTTRTTRSLIPIPIKVKHTQSEPNSPMKAVKDYSLANSKAYKSSPNLSKKFSPVRWGKSRIPRRFNQEVKKSIETKIQINIKDKEKDLLKPPKVEKGHKKVAKSEPKSSTIKKSSKMPTREVCRSPIPIHHEIQVLHNLASRSPSPGRIEDPLFPPSKADSAQDSIQNEKPPNLVDDNKTLAFEIYTSTEEPSHKEISEKSTESITNDTPEKSQTTNEEKEIKSETKVQPNEEKTHKKVLDDNIVENLENMADIKARQRGLQELMRVIQTPTVLESLEERLPTLLHLLFASVQNQLLQSTAEQILSIIFENMDESILKERLQQISINLAKLGSPTGVRLALNIMKKINPKDLVDQLLDPSILGAKSSKIREGALLIVMTVCRIFPSTDLNIERTLKAVISTLGDKKRKVRQAALETLASLAQVAGNTQVLTIANEVVKEQNDLSERQQILKVVRTRLSRKQLPTVNLNGFIRYSMPYGDPEIEWLSRGCSSSSSASPPPSPKNNDYVVEETNNNSRRASEAECSFVPIASTSQRFIQSSSDENKFAPPAKVNYWKVNKRHFEGLEESDIWSEEEPPQPGHTTQIWAVDSSTFQNNNGVRQVYVVNHKQSKSAATNTDFEDTFHETVRRSNSLRGRSFSPPKGRVYDNQEYRNTRWIPKENQKMQKSFSTDQLLTERFRKENTFSSTSSSSSSSTRPNWHHRSSIPVPVYHSQKQKLRIRRSNSRTFKGPVTAYYNDNVMVKNPSLNSTPELLNSASRKASSSGERQPHTFSSGSESSGYFTPPPETDFEANNNRFVRIPSPEKIVSQECESDEEEFANDTTDNAQKEPPELKSSGSLSSLNYVERTLTRNETTNSLQEISRLNFKEQKVMSAQVVTTNVPDRKIVNSAPVLNDLVIADYSPVKTPTPPKTESDSLDDDTPEIISFTASADKKVLIAKATLRRKSSKSSGEKCCHENYTDRPFPKPREALYDICSQLESSDWEMTMKGLRSLERLIKYHREVIENNIHTICVLLGKHIRNLRSQVARNACLVASHLFQLPNKRPLEMELDEVATPLLHRTADTNKFLRADANAALDEMSNSLSIPRVVSLVTYRGSQHQNAIVRCTSVRLLCNIVQKLGPGKVFQLPRDTRDKILLSAANGLTEGSLETRQHAKLLLATLSNHVQFQRAMSEAVPANILRHINKTMKMLVK